MKSPHNYLPNATGKEFRFREEIRILYRIFNFLPIAFWQRIIMRFPPYITLYTPIICQLAKGGDFPPVFEPIRGIYGGPWQIGKEFNSTGKRDEEVASGIHPFSLLVLTQKLLENRTGHLINRKALYMRKAPSSGAKLSTKMSVSWPVTCGKLWRNARRFNDLRDFLDWRPVYAE